MADGGRGDERTDADAIGDRGDGREHGPRFVDIAVLDAAVLGVGHEVVGVPEAVIAVLVRVLGQRSNVFPRTIG